MVQVTVDQIVDVVAVRNRRVAAAGSMPVFCVVPAASVVGGAVRRIPAADLEAVFIDVAVVGMVHVAVVQVDRDFDALARVAPLRVRRLAR
jgi:hypothetical protein